MKIALCGRLPGRFKHPGGLEVVVVQLAEYLSERGHEVTLYGKNIPPQEFIDYCKKHGIKLDYIREVPVALIYPYMLANGFLFLRKIAKKCDIIHSHFGAFAFLAGLLVHGRCANIINIHEIIQTKYRQNLIRKIGGHVENMLMRLATRKADVIIVHSQYMKQLVKKCWHVDSIIIPNGINVVHFKPSKLYEMDKLWGQTKHRILYVGRLEERKGIIQLIESMKVLIKNKEFTDSKLCVVGQGDILPQIEEAVTRLGLESHVIIYGGATQEELPFLYSSADLTAVPSLYEPFGIVPLESLACGTPVVVGDNTGLKEIVNKEVAYFIPEIRAEVIAEIIKNALSSRLPSPQTCREYIIQNYSWPKIISQYEQIYNEVVFT